MEKQVSAMFPAMAHPFISDVFRDGRNLRKKIFNFLLNSIEMKKKRTSLFSYPYYCVLDPTNICNLKCPLCPTWQQTEARPKRKMDMKMFRAIMDEIGPYLFAINLCNWGEPFLNPELPEMVRYAKQFNMVTGMSTNLNYLPDETARGIIDAGLDLMVISLDGISQESYARYRRGGNLEKVLGNIRKLNACRKENEKFPLLIWQFLVNRYNESEIEDAGKVAEELGLQFCVSSMRTSMGKELLLPLHERAQEMKDWLPENPAYNRYAQDIKPGTRTKQATCKWLWNSVVVNSDGSLSPCCGVFEKKWDFSSCHDNSEPKPLTLHNAWNGPRYRLARRLVAAYLNKSPDLSSALGNATDEDLICTRCIQYGFLED